MGRTYTQHEVKGTRFVPRPENTAVHEEYILLYMNTRPPGTYILLLASYVYTAVAFIHSLQVTIKTNLLLLSNVSRAGSWYVQSRHSSRHQQSLVTKDTSTTAAMPAGNATLVVPADGQFGFENCGYIRVQPAKS